MTLRDNRLIGMGPDSGAFAEWDKWVADRVAQRTAATADVMKEAGLTTPLPGLAGMKGQGTFFACAPYGTCWEPTPPMTPSNQRTSFPNPGRLPPQAGDSRHTWCKQTLSPPPSFDWRS